MNTLLKKSYFLFVVTICSLLVIWGCTRKTITPQDTLVVALTSEPTNLDPLFALDANSQRIDQLLYDSLVTIDDQLKIVPHLATSWENPTNTIYRFKLHQRATFHDGTSVTAKSIIQSINRLLHPETGSPFRPGFKNIKNTKILNSYELEIELHEPQASFLTDLTLIKALPESYPKTRSKTWPKKLIGSGPYKIVKKGTNQIVLKRNPTYFKGPAKTENIIFKIVKDDHTRLLKLKKGEIDLVQNALNADSVLQAEKDAKLTITKSAGLNYSYLGFNLKDSILKNIKVRQAIAHAINREEIITHLLHNLAAEAKNVLSPLNWYYEEEVSSYEYDIEKAKRLLKASGIKQPIQLKFKTSTNTESVNIARLISNQLKKIGIEVSIQTHEWGTFFKDIKSGNFQLFSLRWVGVTDPDIYYELFHSSNVPPGRNRVYYSNKRLDTLLEKGKTTVNLKKRRKIYSTVQKIIAKDLPYVSLWHSSNVAVYGNRVKGFHFHPQANFTPFVHLYK